jgi:hypothetical protein
MATSDDTDVANFNAKVNYNISVHMASTLRPCLVPKIFAK